MTDDKANDISEATEDNRAGLPEAASEATETPPSSEDQKLSDLMASSSEPEAQVDDSRATAMEQEALAAAEQALSDGEEAVAEAEQALAGEVHTQGAGAPTQTPAQRRGRNEQVLRVLLAVNVVAMVVVALMPTPSTDAPLPEAAAPAPLAPAPAPSPVMNEPWNRALRASEQREWATAVTILEGYLQDREGMVPSERLSVLSALSYYASQAHDFDASRRYAQQAQALKQSHSLPEDLVQEAEAARASGNQAALRRVLARFLLQQEEVPSHLYAYLAQAYLELGDSYREDAAAGARAARIQEMKEAAARLRAEALRREEGR